MKLHPTFDENMRALLGGEYGAYLESLAAPPVRGLRVNTRKISVSEFVAGFPLPLTPSGYTEDGFVLAPGAGAIGQTPAHHAGLFYVQDPSATVAAEALRPHLGKRVLDLCAAPGGKTAQLACHLPEDGVLVSNDVVFSRARILQSNLERMGVENALVTCNPPADFAALFPEWFDAVLVDAPCSGEGMFRKEDAARRDWSPASVEACARRQSDILDCAAHALRAGGFLLYSTCTLNTTENEDVVKTFLKTHDFETVPVHDPLKNQCRPGFDLPDAIRVFPHTGTGEGHFACLMRKRSGVGARPIPLTLPYAPCKPSASLCALREKLTRRAPFGVLRKTGEFFFDVPEHVPFVRGLNVLKAGVTICTEFRDGRLEPHHNFATALKKGERSDGVDFAADSPEVSLYLHGDAIPCAADFSGFGILGVQGYPLGLVKSAGGVLKNHYPKGLRNLS